MYLLDTNVISELRRRRPHGAVLAWISGIPDNDIYLSAISAGEIQRGIELTRERDENKAMELSLWLSTLLASTNVIPLDAACMIRWAQLMHRKSPQLLADAMIAATASVYDMTVVTRDVADFTQFDVPVLNPFEHKM